MQFRDRVFEELGKSAGMENLLASEAKPVAATARATAPVDEGDYRDGIRIRIVERRYRLVALVVGEDWKTILVESKTGNLARALKKHKKGRYG
jgi:hypothetical protein